MLIDWFTVTAQVINFLVLVWLLKRFLYRPILNAMDARERKIAEQLRDAENQKREAEGRSERLRVAMEGFERQKQTSLAEAKAEIESVRQHLMEEARKEVEELRTKWREALREEENGLHAEIVDSVQKEVFAIAKRTLRDLAGKELEQQITTAFLRRLEGLDDDEKKQFEFVVRAPNSALIVRSAFDLPPATRNEIEKTICQRFQGKAPLRFQVDPELVGGIELASDGHKVSWNIAGYLSSLEQTVHRLVGPTPISHGQIR